MGKVYIVFKIVAAKDWGTMDDVEELEVDKVFVDRQKAVDYIRSVTEYDDDIHEGDQIYDHIEGDTEIYYGYEPYDVEL